MYWQFFFKKVITIVIQIVFFFLFFLKIDLTVMLRYTKRLCIYKCRGQRGTLNPQYRVQRGVLNPQYMGQRRMLNPQYMGQRRMLNPQYRSGIRCDIASLTNTVGANIWTV